MSSHYFSVELREIVADHATHPGIQWLEPFVDEFGLIRRHSQTNHDVPAWCPVLLLKVYQFVVLLITHTYVWLRNVGPLLTQSQLPSVYGSCLLVRPSGVV